MLGNWIGTFHSKAQPERRVVHSGNWDCHGRKLKQTFKATPEERPKKTQANLKRQKIRRMAICQDLAPTSGVLIPKGITFHNVHALSLQAVNRGPDDVVRVACPFDNLFDHDSARCGAFQDCTNFSDLLRGSFKSG
jgi:hypothetical protein